MTERTYEWRQGARVVVRGGACPVSVRGRGRARLRHRPGAGGSGGGAGALERAADLVARADLDALDDRGLPEHAVAVDGSSSGRPAAGSTPATFVLGMGPYRPVAFGRTMRTIPDHIRPLLAMIHGHCRGPGCDRPIAWTQAMHTDQDWAEGGTTELDTTAAGCLAHHQLRDIVGWNVDLDPTTATCRWTSPDRRTVITTHPPPQTRGVRTGDGTRSQNGISTRKSAAR